MMRRWIAILPVAAWAVALPAADRPLAGTPGSDAEIATVEARCPTFSWAARPGTERWRLAVYRVGEESTRGQGASSLVLSERIPGGFSSWTPALGRCLVRGETYAWSIGAEDRRGRTVWSVPRVFRVTARPVDLDEAAAVASRPAGEERREEPAAGARRQPSGENPAGGAPTAFARPPSRTGSGIESAAPLGNLGLEIAGDLRLADSRPVLRLEHDGPGLRRWDVTATEFGFFVVNDTSGVTAMSILNGAPTGALEINDSGVSIAGDLFCTDCVSGGDVAADSLGAADLGASAVGLQEIAAIWHVRVECNGECHDGSVGDVCSALGLGTLRPLAVSCAQVQGFSTTVPCGGDNVCSVLDFNPDASKLQSTSAISQMCDDISGWDAVVYCIEAGS